MENHFLEHQQKAEQFMDHQRKREFEQRIEEQRREMDIRFGAVERTFVGQEKAVNVALIAAEKAVNAALTAAKEAVQKAEMTSEKQFDAVNEFRAELANQVRNFMTREEADAKFSAQTERLNTLSSYMDKMTGRTGGQASTSSTMVIVVTVILAGITCLVGVVSMLWSHK
jgi:hypothetical protein